MHTLSSSPSFFLRSQLSAKLDTASRRIPHFHFELRTTIGNTNRNSDPKSLLQFHLRTAGTCIERRNFSTHPARSPQIFCPFLSRAHPLPSGGFVSAFVCIHACGRACLSQGFPDDLARCTRGVIKDRGQRPFPFHGKMNDPVWKWLPMASGQLEFAVSQQRSLLCVQRQVLEKKRNTRHITHSAETSPPQ